MRAGNIVAVIATVSTLFIAAAQAQSIPPLLEQPNQSACAPYGAGAAPRSNETTGSRSLSDQLVASKGVICPRVGDPNIRPK